MAKINKTIRFEDHGQDFLEWDIEDDFVVDCRPFQGSVWCGCELVPQVIDPGAHVRLITKYGDLLELRYPIEEVMELKPTASR